MGKAPPGGREHWGDAPTFYRDSRGLPIGDCAGLHRDDQEASASREPPLAFPLNPNIISTVSATRVETPFFDKPTLMERLIEGDD
jgi:hypothetical protein